MTNDEKYHRQNRANTSKIARAELRTGISVDFYFYLNWWAQNLVKKRLLQDSQVY